MYRACWYVKWFVLEEGLLANGIVELWNGRMYSMVGRRNDTMRLRMRTGMNGRIDEILMASLALDVCIYNLLYLDADENRQARQNEQIWFYQRVDRWFRYFSWIKWVIFHDQLRLYRYPMPLIHRVIAFPPHAILSKMFYEPVLRASWFILWQAALKSYDSYSSRTKRIVQCPFYTTSSPFRHPPSGHNFYENPQKFDCVLENP